MDRRLQESVTRGDILSLRKLIEQNVKIVWQQVPGSLNTVLHLAARFGHLEFAKEVVITCPDMVSMENADLETPLHESCREGYLEIVKLLVEIDPWIVYKLNCREKSCFYVACERGNVHVIRYLMNFPGLLMLEVDMKTSSLHVAASSGYTEIVKEILKLRPDFAWKKDSHGFTPLHLACTKGQLDITRELLKLDSDLCLMQDIQGRIPLQCAAIRGRINVIDEILSTSLESAEMTTFSGETILHLGVKNNQYETVKFLTEKLDMTKLLNVQDGDGNTVLHLATAGKLTAMVIYLLKIGVDVNALNKKGYTALDVVESDASNSGPLAIAPALQEAGAKSHDQLSPGLANIQQILQTSPNNPIHWPSRTPQYRSPSHLKNKANRQRAKKLEFQKEGLRNARKTISIVAVLIATVTFSAGINPPGGFSQETGKALRGNRAAFKVFLACNIVALFLSIGVVNVLVSIIPFTQKTMMKLLSVTHKVMWLSTLFMTAAYIAGVWTIMPGGNWAKWMSVELVVFGVACTIAVFLGLGSMLATHWHNKSKWRKSRRRKGKDETPKSSISSRVNEMKTMKNIDSSNSDVDSSDHGYHLY